MADLVRGRASRSGSLRRSQQRDRGPRTEYLAFRLAGDQYAAPVAIIREILKSPPLTEVPRAPHAVLGIISVRGQLVTVVDLRRRLRLEETAPTRRSRVLLAESDARETIGLLVDEVLQVYRFAEDEIELAAPALGGEVADFIAGIARPVDEAIATKRAENAARRSSRATRLSAGALAAGEPEPSPTVLLRSRSQGAEPPRQAPSLAGSSSEAEFIILLDLRAILRSLSRG